MILFHKTCIFILYCIFVLIFSKIFRRPSYIRKQISDLIISRYELRIWNITICKLSNKQCQKIQIIQQIAKELQKIKLNFNNLKFTLIFRIKI